MANAELTACLLRKARRRDFIALNPLLMYYYTTQGFLNEVMANKDAILNEHSATKVEINSVPYKYTLDMGHIVGTIKSINHCLVCLPRNNDPAFIIYDGICIEKISHTKITGWRAKIAFKTTGYSWGNSLFVAYFKICTSDGNIYMCDTGVIEILARKGRVRTPKKLAAAE